MASKLCAVGNGNSSVPTTCKVSTSSSYSETISADFDFDIAQGAADGLGVSVTRTNTAECDGTFTIPAYDWGKVWTRQLMVWQDQQYQHCHKYYYGSNGIKCGAWSPYVHGDIPVKNGAVFTWSTGYNNMDFSSCGGRNIWHL